MTPPKKPTPFQRMSDAIERKDWDKVDAELARFARYMGRHVTNPKLQPIERIGVFALGLASAAARRYLLPPKGKK